MFNIGNEILKYALAIILSFIGGLLVVKGSLSPLSHDASVAEIMSQSKEMCISVVGIFTTFLLIGILFTYAHITRIKLTEARRLTKVLKKKDEIKTKFLAFAAHNLRTPATALRWSLNDFLKNEYGHLNKEQKASIQDLYSVSLNMLNIIEDFLDISKLELQRFEINLKRTPVKELRDEIEHAISEFAPLAKEQGITVEKKFLAKEKEDIHIDISHIARVIENLIENAINYTPAKGTVSIELAHNKENLVFTIKDTGIGIPKSEHPMIFSEFFRASNAKKQKSTGSGIGLYLARKVIEAHSGTITFASKENGGTTFTFTLPIIKEGEREVANVFRRI